MRSSKDRSIESTHNRRTEPAGAWPGSSVPIDAVVVELQHLVRDASVDFSMRVGALIIERFFDGEPESYPGRGGQASLRQLARHPELPLSASALHRCIGLYVLTRRIGDLRRYERLGTSHFRAVLGLAPPEQQRLLEEANQRRWTVVKLEAEATQRRAPQGRAGRPRVPAALKALRQVERLTRAPSVVGQSPWGELSGPQRRELAQLASRTRLWLEDVERQLAAVRGGDGS